MLTWDEVRGTHGRNDLPAVLFNEAARLSDEEVAQGIHDAWVSAEWPVQCLDVREDWDEHKDVLVYSGVDLWIEYLFERVGPLHNDDRVSAESLVPEEGLTLYRGAIEDLAVGMSWTASRERAEWFARRFNGIRHPLYGEGLVGHLYRLEVSRAEADMVLAHFDSESGRAEDEYVIDCRGFDDSWIEDLGEVQRIKYAV